jgi:gallate dioxygenase
MATIIGAIASSHTPTIGFALDAGKQQDPAWAPIFAAYAPVSEWLARKKPDVLLVVYNDHVTSFFFDHYSAFALGIGDTYHAADEGGGPRNLPPARGHVELARHVGASLVADEFDMSFFQDKPLDHGCFSPMSVMLPHEGEWPVKILPLQVGVLQFPAPSARRCYKLGQAIRRAVESYPEDLKVAIVATGGLSHQVHGERAGFNNTAWDHQFLDLFEPIPRLLDITHAEYAKRGGFESAEVVMWMVMRGAMSSRVRCLHRDYYLPSMTGIAVAVYENESADDPTLRGACRTPARAHRSSVARDRATGRDVPVHAGNQRARIPDQPLSASAYRSGIPRAIPRRSGGNLRRGGTDAGRARHDHAPRLARHDPLRRDFLPAGEARRGLRCLEPAYLRGDAWPVLEDFQKTRNAPGALYSVAGSGSASWSAKS